MQTWSPQSMQDQQHITTKRSMVEFGASEWANRALLLAYTSHGSHLVRGTIES